MLDDFRSPETPDFRVRSISDKQEFYVHRNALRTSEVFRDMFLCCDQGYDLVDADEAQGAAQVLELDESVTTLRLLLRLLHHPPPPPSLSPSAPRTRRMGKPVSLYQGALIPFPLLPDMLRLADKYELSDPLRRTFHAHLLANAAVHPLEVYAFAAKNALSDVAAEASAFLLQPPLSTYSKRQIALFPSVSAYHDLVRLHDHRIQQLKATLLGEDLFPFGYGACPVHQENAVHTWNNTRMSLAARVEAATDIAAEMGVLLKVFDSCRTCSRACSAATEMLRVTCASPPA